MKLKTAAEMATTAVQEPEKVPPFVRNQAKQKVTSVNRRLATRRATRDLVDQRNYLNSIRKTDNWLLVVLDACRYDIFEREFRRWFTGRCHAMQSAGRDTFEYVRKCWPNQYPDVTYLSGATPINDQEIDYEEDVFNELYQGYTPAEHLDIVDVWQQSWDDSLGTCPPWAVANAALERSYHPKLVAHMFQPHAPYIGRAAQLLGHTMTEHARPHEGEPIDKPIWERVRYGDVTRHQLHEAYRANLCCALREVARLVEQMPHDRVFVMGDHGEALGEYGVYSHPRIEHPHIRQVPRAEITGLTEYGKEQAAKAGERESQQNGTESNVEERLEELGYL